MSVQSEVERLTGVTQNRREDEQKFLARIVEALDDLPDKQYNKLSKDAQGWAEEATEAYSDKEDIPAFPEAEEDESEDEPAESEEEETEDADADDDGELETDEPEDEDMPATQTDEDEAPRRRKAAPPAKKTVSAGKSKASVKTSAKSDGKAVKAGGALTYARELLVKNPDIPMADLSAKIKAKGYAASVQTLHTTRSGFRQDVRALQNAGLLKRKLV